MKTLHKTLSHIKWALYLIFLGLIIICESHVKAATVFYPPSVEIYYYDVNTDTIIWQEGNLNTDGTFSLIGEVDFSYASYSYFDLGGIEGKYLIQPSTWNLGAKPLNWKKYYTVSPATYQVTVSFETIEYYVIQTPPGTLCVKITPTKAAKAGAMWQVDWGAWYKSGASVSLSPGNHNISFKPVNGWVLPQNQTVTIYSKKRCNASAIY